MTIHKFCSLLMTLLVAVFLSGVVMAQTQTTDSPLRVYAAGSLREPLSEIAKGYEAATSTRIALTFGASGLLRERIEKGEPAQVFASADMQHPEKLALTPAWQPPARMVRNTLCALANPLANVTTANLLERMLSPAIKLGTSTPKADPSGDYAWDLFRRADSVSPGAYAALNAKALQLTGAATSPQPPPGSKVKGTYAWLMDEGQADIFLTYCTNAISARKEVPRLNVVAVGPALEVGAAYGLTARACDAAGARFAQYLLMPTAQSVFTNFGFGTP